MPPYRSAPAAAGGTDQPSASSVLHQLLAIPRALLLDRRYYVHLVALLVLGEAVLGLLIIWKVPYTKIDWDAYMQHVALFRAGERDYSRLIGETGPCVYPALFLYIYTLLSRVLPDPNSSRPSLPLAGQTIDAPAPSSPVQIRAAQYVFLGIYLTTLVLVSGIYYLAGSDAPSKPAPSPPQQPTADAKDKDKDARPTQPAVLAQTTATNRFPQALLVPLTLSKRAHSLYMLRLFNDPIAMLLLYAAVLLMMLGSTRTGSGRGGAGWTWGCRLFSLALGVKMNILLFLPGLLVLLVQYRGIAKTLRHTIEIVLIQLILPAPYFLSSPEHRRAYFSSAFNFGRAFLYKWSVNMRFIPERIFVEPGVALGLLISQALFLIVFALGVWSPIPQGTLGVAWRAIKKPFAAPVQPGQLGASHIPLVLFSSNLVGMYCARSLHYQFHCWYFHQIPFLLFAGEARKSIALCTAIWLGIEYAWSTFPATFSSSLVLFIAHYTLLASLHPWLRVRLVPALRGLHAESRVVFWVFAPGMAAWVAWCVRMALNALWREFGEEAGLGMDGKGLPGS